MIVFWPPVTTVVTLPARENAAVPAATLVTWMFAPAPQAAGTLAATTPMTARCIFSLDHALVRTETVLPAFVIKTLQYHSSPGCHARNPPSMAKEILIPTDRPTCNPLTVPALLPVNTTVWRRYAPGCCRRKPGRRCPSTRRRNPCEC